MCKKNKPQTFTDSALSPQHFKQFLKTIHKSPVKLILQWCKTNWSHLKFRSTKRCNCSINKLAVHRQERLLALCIIKKCRAAGSVSRGADAAYSIPDRLTDGVQNRPTATCLFSSFLGSKLLYRRCLLSTSYHRGFRSSCLICRKLPCDKDLRL